MKLPRSGRESIVSAMPKREKKAKNTTIKNKKQHIIYHNRNKAETSKEANKRA
jgi:hypothetical protein